MNEQEFSQRHVLPHLRQWGDASRIENSAESGTPDVTYAIDGQQGWIETKIIRNGVLTFERFQLPWLKRRLRVAHGNLWIFATDSDGLYVYSAEQIIKAPHYPTKRKTIEVLVEELEPLVFGAAQPWPWGAVLLMLTRHALRFTPTKV